MARKVFPSNPNTNDVFTSGRGKKFLWNGKVWKRTQDTNVESMTLDSSADEKLALHGSDNPTIRFREGSNDKGNLHWKASTGEMRLVNEESSQELRLGSSGVTVTGDLDVTGNLEVTGTTTFNGGTLTLGDSATDNVVFGADVNSSITPNTDDTYDLGSSSKEWRNLYIDGTANIDTLNADSSTLTTVDINGGSIDGARIGSNSASSGAFTTLSASSAATFNGNVDLGNATSDTITATGRFDSDLVPSTDSANALGTTALRWSNLFIDAATVTDDVSIGGNLEVIGNANITGTLTYEDVTNIDSVGIVTARSGLVVSSGGANITGGITGALTGNVTGNADTATTLETSRTLSISGAGTGSASFNGGANADIALTLADSGVTAGTYGSSSAIPAITVDAKGLVTSASTTAIDSTSISNGGESVSVSSGGQITSSANHDFSSGIDVAGNITLGDNDEIRFGDDNDAKINVDGSQNFVMQGNGTTYLRGSTVIIGANGGSGGFETAIRVTEVSSTTSQVELYYDNSLVLETVSTGVDLTGNLTVSGTVDGRDIATDGSKLDGIEASADVTDATNVNAAGAVMNSDTSTGSMSFVVDEDNMSSNSATKVPTQQSVKNYVDTEVAGVIDSAPGALNTLNELAAALGDDASFSTTVTNSIATKLPKSGGQMTGNITFSGSQTVDGRDLSSDGSKLDGIESGATADQTAAEIRSLVESASDSNVFTDADHSKLNGIAASATNVTNNNQITNGAGYITGFDITTQTDSKYLRSNTADTASGDITFSGGAGAVSIAAGSDIRFTSGNWTGDYAGKIQYHSNHMYIQYNSNVYFRNSGGSNVANIDNSGNLGVSGQVTASSDVRLKKNITTIDNALDKVLNLRGVEFDYKENDVHSIGVIAQEVEEVLPDLVHTDEEDNFKSVAYGNLTAVLIEAVKELTAEVNTLKAELNTIKGE
jgi:hypothetical protein